MAVQLEPTTDSKYLKNLKKQNLNKKNKRVLQHQST